MSLTYLQADRPMTVTTPLGPDVLLLTGFAGDEAISQLFRFQLDLVTEDQTLVEFDKLLGRMVTINLTRPEEGRRHFSGICASLSQGMRERNLTTFRMEIVPNLWFLTCSAERSSSTSPSPRSSARSWRSPTSSSARGDVPPADYCVQYRETDFHASRLMEEEGIYYYFRHHARGHQTVVSDRANFPELQPGTLILQAIEGPHVEEQRVTRWETRQHLRSGKVTLRDHTFELPHKALEAAVVIQESVQVGQMTHKLKIGRSGEKFELYDWPGAYAQRVDGVDDGGIDRPGELEQIFKDNQRTAGIRMQQEASESVVVQGASRYRHLVSGHAFTLEERVGLPYVGNSSRDGRYVLTAVGHVGRMADNYRSGEEAGTLYENTFTCVPAGLPFRPRRVTPRPMITGPQSAVVVGPPGEEIHTDKYGRVKVQFHWDRQGRQDDDSSCWVRVAQIAAGGGFGGVHIPRVGQ
ncbi:MAG: type VI secretion system tip protein TssI/VgrG, partial [Singulisphaera sp.]